MGERIREKFWFQTVSSVTHRKTDPRLGFFTAADLFERKQSQLRCFIVRAQKVEIVN